MRRKRSSSTAATSLPSTTMAAEASAWWALMPRMIMRSECRRQNPEARNRRPSSARFLIHFCILRSAFCILLPVRVVFVNRYFYPDHSATSQMLADLAFHLVGRGWDVSVITSRLSYDDPNVGRASARQRRAEARPTFETVRGVDVHRIWTTRFGRGSLWGRSFDYLTFYVSAFFAIRR